MWKLDKRKVDRGTGVQEELTECKEGYFLSIGKKQKIVHSI